MKFIVIAWISTILIAVPAMGQQMYKCPDASGVAKFQQMPCSPTGGGETITVKPIPRGAGSGSSDKADERDHANQTPSSEPETVVEKFSRRLAELVPDMKSDLERNPDVRKSFYGFGKAACVGPWKSMTPEQFGKQGQPFFPQDVGAAIARAARETICPESK